MSDLDLINPRATIGDNQAPDYAQKVTDRMADEYSASIEEADRLLAEARECPKEVNDDVTFGKFGALVVKLRDMSARLKAYHQAEKAPYLRAGEGVDNFFFGLMSKLARRNKGDIAGAADVLSARADVYNQRKLAEERRIREETERKAREEAAEQQRIAQENERKRIEAEQAAERARKPENVEAHLQVADQHAAAAAVASANVEIAQDRLVDARIAVAAKPADMVRTRHETGVLSTMRPEPHVEITDASKLNATLLWAFVKDDQKLQALKAWAKITQHKTPMEGAIIEMRNKTVWKG